MTSRDVTSGDVTRRDGAPSAHDSPEIVHVVDFGHNRRMESDGTDVLPKPNELLALDGVTTELFDTLRRWFGVPESISLNLESIDSAVTELGDPMLVMAMAMRKLQALNLLSTPGVRTTTDIVITIVQDLDRALVQAPNMRLNLAAASTDWDAAFVAIEADVPLSHEGPSPSPEVDDEDLEASRFQELHASLHAAVYAVMAASEGEIRYFI